jgi:hypothetical protein
MLDAGPEDDSNNEVMYRGSLPEELTRSMVWLVIEGDIVWSSARSQLEHDLVIDRDQRRQRRSRATIE